MEIKNRINALRDKMAEHGIDAYIIVTDDFHASEYVDNYFKCREYMSGFSGSAGTLVVTKDEARLWTDGRYFIQAEKELAGTDIILMKQGEPGVIDVKQYVKECTENDTDSITVGYDGRTISFKYATELKKILKANNAKFIENVDLVGEIWTDRPAFPSGEIYELEEKYAGESRESKLERVRAEIKKAGADCHFIASLDDIMWLYNIRGNDIMYSPVAMSYTIIYEDRAVLFVSERALNDELKDKLTACNIEIRPYLEAYDFVKALGECKVLLDLTTVNVAIISSLSADTKYIHRLNPTTVMKSRKNAVEMENERIAHIEDGVAVTKIMYWLKQMAKNNLAENGEFKVVTNGLVDGSPDGSAAVVTELYVSEKLLGFRKERPGFIDQSFAPIIATGEHGAIVHYDPTEETDIPVQNNTFLLMDTGGHYYNGTTDITRTVAIGEVTPEMKKHYTAVLRGNLNLGAMKFKEGTTGPNLDAIARGPLWEMGLDYRHGTGHGVGYLLNVHEGPQSIRPRDLAGRAPFAEGMLTSNEPGLYIEGEYGIRLENLVLTVKDEKTEYGQFYKFETVTMVPWDLDAVDTSLMSKKEIELLNDYHRTVYEKLAPYLNEDERAWLKEATREV